MSHPMQKQVKIDIRGRFLIKKRKNTITKREMTACEEIDQFCKVTAACYI